MTNNSKRLINDSCAQLLGDLIIACDTKEDALSCVETLRRMVNAVEFVPSDENPVVAKKK